jgi:Zn-dependent protease with chaperone function
MERRLSSARTGRGRVVTLAALGYAYIALVLLAILGGIAACVYGVVTGHALLLKVAIPLAILVFTMARAFAVRIEPPAGISLSRTDGAALWRLTEDARKQLGSPRIDHIVMTDDVNAAVMQVPRFGPFGPSRAYLVAGLPLMQALSPTEFEAVVGHELGHLSRKHGRFGAWVYTTRKRWEQLVVRMEERESTLLWVLLPFFRWLVPRFDDATLATSRAHELEADHEAALLAGPEAAADALVAVAAAGTVAGEHWQSVWAHTAETSQPDRSAALQLGATMKVLRADERYYDWVQAALASETLPYDTHPSLAERLAALGQTAEEVAGRRRAPDPTAAQTLLGDLEGRLEEQFAAEWARVAHPAWHAEHRRVATEREQLARLQELGPDRLGPEQLLEVARLTEAYGASAEAGAAWRRVLEVTPDEAEAVFRHGEHLLREGDDAGLESLVQAAELDPDALFAAFVVAAGYLGEHGRDAELEGWTRRLGLEG